MSEMVQANWWLFVIALLIGIAVAWWIFVASRRTKVERSTKGDVLDEGATRARRNQALIDRPEKGAAPPVADALHAATVLPTEDAAPSHPPAEVPTPPPAAAPAPTPAPAPAPAAAATGTDDLKRIKGVGPKLEKLLQGLGVTSYAQIAAWDEAEIDRIDAQLGNFQGRIRRDNWPEQAKLLAAGDTAGFKDRFGNV